MFDTAEMALDPDKEFEIVSGQAEEKKAGGARHSGIGVRLLSRLVSHVSSGRRLLR